MPKSWNISVSRSASDLVQVGEGYALPGRFTITASSGDLQVEIDAAVTAGRARARRVAVSRDPDVTSTTLRSVPIRDLIAWAIIETLLRVELRKTGAKLTPVTEPGEAEIAVVKKLVGYVEVRP